MFHLNLTSLKNKEKIKKTNLYIKLSNTLILLTIFIIMVAGASLVTNNIIQNKLNQIEKQPQSNEKLMKLNTIKNKFDKIEDVQKNYVKWSLVMQNFLSHVPEKNILNRLTFDKKNNTFNITGFAKQRDNFLQFKENLEESEMTNTIKSPISNLLHQTDINFKLSGQLNL